jgi:folate-binding Fe-S cluster repair protein YgfZ
MTVPALRVARRPREFVGVGGPDAASYLQAMVSNDVAGLGLGQACEALLLTSKARVIAPLTVLRRGADDFLLLTEPALGERVRSVLLRSRFAAKCEIETEVHDSVVVFGDVEGIPTTDYGATAVEVLDGVNAPTIGDDELELLRIKAGLRDGVARSTTGSFRLRRGSMLVPSTSRRGATRARSRSRGSTIAVA